MKKIIVQIPLIAHIILLIYLHFNYFSAIIKEQHKHMKVKISMIDKNNINSKNNVKLIKQMIKNVMHIQLIVTLICPFS